MNRCGGNCVAVEDPYSIYMFLNGTFKAEIIQ